MAISINIKDGVLRKSGTDKNIEIVKRFLPSELVCELAAEAEKCRAIQGRIEEIRIRSERRTYITVGRRGKNDEKNILLSTILSEDAVSDILRRMCDGSLYAYSESIIKGFISLDGGIRVGVCGRASVEKERILGVYNIHALNIRFPCENISPDRDLISLIKNTVDKGEGVLIYSPPAEGKTTLLRSVASSLSGGKHPMRVSLVDTREELGSFLCGKELSLDILSGYPQAEGIRIATAFMNPEIIICDEIGSEADAAAIAGAQNCGVPLIASAHGASLKNLLLRRGIRLLHDIGAFGLYVGIGISELGGFRYKAQSREEAEREIHRDITDAR